MSGFQFHDVKMTAAIVGRTFMFQARGRVKTKHREGDMCQLSMFLFIFNVTALLEALTNVSTYISPPKREGHMTKQVVI